MPRFVPKRYEQILAKEIAKVVARSGLSDISDTSVMKHILAATARAIDEAYYDASQILKQFSIDTATGEDLDARAAEIQPGVITRNASTSASGDVVFSRAGTTGTVVIPAGTRVKTSDGTEFETTASASITPSSPEQIGGHGVGRDSGLTNATAVNPGAAGNVASGTIVKFSSKPAGVDEVTNLAAFIGGSDKESDDAFRARIKAYVASLGNCTITALETAVLGAQEPTSGATILFSRAIEDTVDLGEVTLYIDDGTGTAESSATQTDTNLAATYTWNGTTTVTTADTSEVAVGDYIKLVSDGQIFRIGTITPSTSVTILNPGALTIPTGSTTTAKVIENLCFGLSGPLPNTAVGGEDYLYIDNIPIKSAVAPSLVSSTRGALTDTVDYIINPPDGQVHFLTALTAGEAVSAEYTYYTGLIALAQLIVDGDPNDRTTYPGVRAAGVRVTVQTPQVLLQNVEAVITTIEGYEYATVIDAVTESVKSYINNLGISGDVLRAKIIQKIMATPGIFNVQLTTPATDVTILDDQLARTTDSNIDII